MILKRLFLLIWIAFFVESSLGATKDIPLFDGKTLAGWTKENGSTPDTGWIVEDGCMVLVKHSGSVYSKASFKDFDFSFEWKIEAGCNSGVKYRFADYSGASIGPEYQLLDDAKRNYSPGAKGSAASIYAIKGPSATKKLAPIGKFNKSRIIAKGNDLEHWLNGEKVVKIKIGSREWMQLHAASKFKKSPEFGTRKGRIMLQDHGGKVWFRNLIIRAL
ncbi:MAG: DUF1080 domain-containing protein [Opitutae bacterium]|jgi:hypothetical protein|nr:DUF1080 domain-containing protein [Opitutae bacterium]